LLLTIFNAAAKDQPRIGLLMKLSSWAIIAVLLAFLAAAIWFGYEGLTTEQDVQISSHGYIAMAIGIVFSLVVGIGLMALVFYSSRAGYDEPPRQIGEGRNGEEDQA
jgi:hypothetical protein